METRTIYAIACCLTAVWGLSFAIAAFLVRLAEKSNTESLYNTAGWLFIVASLSLILSIFIFIIHGMVLYQ